MSDSSPSIYVPKLSHQFLKWALPSDLLAPILGDLEEEFYEKALICPNEAITWYRRQAIQTGLQFMLKTKRGLLMFITSVLLFAVLTYFAMWASIGFSMFVNVPSLLVIIPPAIAFTISVTSWQEVKKALSLLISPQTRLENDVYENSRQVFGVMGTTSILLGIFMTLIGVIGTAININTENFAQDFGPAFAVCILTLIYGLAIKVVCYVAEQMIINLSRKN